MKFAHEESEKKLAELSSAHKESERRRNESEKKLAEALRYITELIRHVNVGNGNPMPPMPELLRIDIDGINHTSP